MNKELSAYLDLTRVLGTLIVFFGHVELNWVPEGDRFFEPVGNESLALMFVVRGFVIGFVSDRREKTLKSFLIHRCARAYLLLIPCVIFGFFLYSFGKHFMAAYYLHGSWPPLSSDVRALAKALFSFTFLGQAWGGDFFPGSMAPYWTFPYEWTYYLLFAALWYLRCWRHQPAIRGIHREAPRGLAAKDRSRRRFHPGLITKPEGAAYFTRFVKPLVIG